MNKNQKIFLIIILITIFILILCWRYIKIKEVIISGPSGDFIYTPIESVCKKELQSYIQGQEFKNQNFLYCKMVESKDIPTERGICDKEKCLNGCSVAGCYVCKLKCF